MAITANQAQGLVLALFGASAGGHLTSLSAASSVAGLAADLATSAGLILGKDLSSNTVFRDHVLSSSLKLTGAALTAAQAWMDGELTKGTARGDILAYAVTYLEGLTDTSSVFYAAASSYRDTVKAAVTWSQGAGASTFGVSALRAQQGNTDVVAGNTFTLTTGADIISGTAGNDTITGVTSRLGSSDVIVDVNANDNDALTITGMSADLNAATVISGIETINFNTEISSGSTFTANADKISGANTLNISRGNLADGLINGKGRVDVLALNGEQVKNVAITGAGTGATNVTQATKAGATVSTDGSGTVTVAGAATVTAANTARVDLNGVSTSVDGAKAYSVNAAKATTINVGQGTEVLGAVTVVAPKATSVAVTASGGADLQVSSTVAATTAHTVALTDIDDSGATVTLGTSGSASATDKSTVGTQTRYATVNLSGTTAATDAATVKASGYITLDAAAATGAVDALTLSGVGSALDVALSATAANPTTITATGSDSVTVRVAADIIDAKAVTGLSTLMLTTADSGTTSDLSKVSGTTQIIVANDSANDTITVASGAKVMIAADQTTGITFYSKTDKGTLNLSTGDDTTDDTASTIATVANTFGTTGKTFSTVNIDATNAIYSAAAVTGTAAQTAFVVTGTKAVTISGAMTGLSFDSTGSTGAVTLSGLTTGMGTFNLGTGADAITVNGAQKYTVNAGAGANTFTLTSFSDGSQFIGGSGIDTVSVASTAAGVISTGAGNDAITIDANVEADSAILGGDGTDTVTLSDTDGNDFSDNANFQLQGIENISITALASGTIKINSVQLASNPSFTLTGTSAAVGVLEIVGKDTSGATADTIDASGITLSTASLVLDGGTGADTVTGSTSADVIRGSLGADSLNGGTGSDTVTYIDTTITGRLQIGTTTDTTAAGANAIRGVVVNLSGSALTGATVYANSGKYLSKSLTSVDAGTAAYLFNEDATANSANIDTLTSIENVTGTSGVDYIAGSDSANVIDGGSGADYISAGGGADTITGGAGIDTIVLTESTAASDTVKLDSADTADRDVITGFGATDIISFDESAFASINFANTAAVAGLAAGDYNEIAALGTVVADKVNVITTAAGYADYATAAAAVTMAANGAEAFIVFYNSTSGKTEIYWDADADDGGSGVLIGQIDISGAGLAAALSNANFAVY